MTVEEAYKKIETAILNNNRQVEDAEITVKVVSKYLKDLKAEQKRLSKLFEELKYTHPLPINNQP